MRKLSTWRALSTIAHQPRPWICRQCRRIHQTRARSTVAPTTSTDAGRRAWKGRIRIPNIPPKERRKVAIAATVVFVAGAGALAFSENARHAYIAGERTGRVATTLALCVYDYHKVLQQRHEPNYRALLAACHKTCAERTLEAMEKNGGIFIKLGQHLSSLHYLLPNEWCDTFIPLQDKCPVSKYSSIDEMVKRDTGHSIDDIFSDFERRPIGAASLAQVHVATLKSTGEKVAVKIQHPYLDEWTKLDLALTRFTFRTLAYWFPEYDLTWLSDEMETSLPAELNFQEEARNALRLKAHFSRIPNSPLLIPNVIWAQRRILVMEFLTGHRPDDLAFLDANHIDRDEVSAALARIFNEMIFGDGAPLHCDPHGGNLAIRLNPARPRPQNFDVILYDHGLYRDIPRDLRRAYAHLWLAVLKGDEAGMRRYAYQLGGIGDAEFPVFAAAITGRDYRVLRQPGGSGVTATPRDEAERQAVTTALSEGGLLEQLVHVLGKVPRILLLILKTNDLTRSLDENLHTHHGPARTFMILARYAARTVFAERVEEIRGSWLWPRNLLAYAKACAAYAKVAVTLRVYEVLLRVKRRFGVETGLV